MARQILLVEDNEIERRLMVNILGQDYTVLEAENGQEALSILLRKGKVISAIILDILMPVMNGFEVLSRIRENAVWSQIPVIVTTGIQDDEAQERALALGANCLLIKPCKSTVVRYLVRNIIAVREKATFSNAIRLDKLTGLLNREAFYTDAEKLIKRKPAGYYVIASLDIEHFKVINDEYGTACGDLVIKHVAKSIEKCISKLDGLCCRKAADKFAVIYPADKVDSPEIRQTYLEATTPSCIPRPIKLRIGRYTIEDPSLPVSAMYDRAALAEEGIRGRYDIHIAEYDESMREKLLQEQQITGDMYAALMEGQFEPWFQPQYNHSTGKRVGAEALARWQHPTKGLIPPSAFVPIFEKNGFIFAMDKYIWESVCRHLRRWLDAKRHPLPISINISRYDIFQPDFYDFITGLITKYSLPKALLRLEITESAFSESADQIINMVERLQAFGFTIEIDDFGSGYSSLNILKDVSADVLKLDMRFFESTGRAQRSGRIVESVIRMAKWLDMPVIAEGVETRAQADYLCSLGCEIIQGYFYAKPMPLEEYEALPLEIGRDIASSLETIDFLDEEAFWNPDSIETMVFNHFSGGAFIFEYCGGHFEMLRINAEFPNAFRTKLSEQEILKIEPLSKLSAVDRRRAIATVERALVGGGAESCDLFSNAYAREGEGEYIHLFVRRISSNKDRHLFYGYVENMTAQRRAEQKEREAEKRRQFAAEQLQAIMDNISGGVSASTVKNGIPTIIFANRQFYQLFGYTKEECDSADVDLFFRIHPDDVGTVTETAHAASKTEERFTARYRIIHRDGSIRWLQGVVSFIAFPGISGAVQLSVTTDITEQLAAEQKERETSERLRVIMDNISGGVVLAAIDGVKVQLLYSNNKYYEILGYTREEYAAAFSDNFGPISSADRPWVKEAARKAFHTDEPLMLEYRATRRDGSEIWLKHRIVKIRSSEVGGLAQLSVIYDVTPEKLLERQNAETSSQRQAILDNIGESISAVAVENGHTQFLFANDQYYSMLGYTRAQYDEEIKNVYSFLYIDDYISTVTAINEVIESGEPASIKYRIVRRDGEVRWLQSSISMVSFPNTSAPVQLTVTVDITEHVISEQALLETDEQLRFLNEMGESLLVEADIDEGINSLLRKLLHYFDGNRAYIFEFGEETAVNTYEVCADGVSSEINNLQFVPLSEAGFWFDAFDSNGYIAIGSTAALGEGRAVERDILLAQGIRSLVAVPLKRDGEYIGFLGIDDARRKLENVDLLVTLGHYTSVRLARRDYKHKIISSAAALQRLAEENREQALVVDNLLKNIPGGVAIYRLGKSPETIFFSDGIAQLIGMTRAEFGAISAKDLIAATIFEDDAEKVSETANRAAKLGTPIEVTFRMKHKSGRLVWVQQSAVHIRDEKGGKVYYSVFTKMPNESVLYKNITDDAVTGVCVCDAETLELLYVNDVLKEAVGCYETAGKTCHEFIQGTDTPCPHCRRAEMQDEDYVSREIHLASTDRYFAVHSHLADDNGRKIVIEYSTEITDIRKKILVQEKMIELALQEAKSANEAKSVFLSQMSHDLRTPMNSIIGLTALAKNECYNPDLTADYLDKIGNSANFLLSLVNDCLDMEKIAQGKMTLHPAPYAYRDFRQSILTMIEPLCAQKNITFTIQERNDAFGIVTDRIRFEQIFFNLLSNAVKYTPNGGHIELLYKNDVYENGTLTLDYIVRDNGCGMSEEFQKRMFEPFEQEYDSTCSPKLQGTGLGLSIVKSIVDMMGGTLSVKSRQGVGTDMIVHLTTPVVPQDVKTQEYIEHSDYVQILKGSNVLLVEDNPVNVLIAMRLLENKQVIVTVADNGKEGVSTFAASEESFFDAVLMDIQMPVMNGIDATLAIRELPREDAQTVPIIAMTANAFAEDFERSLASGMNAHLSKPIIPELMYNTIAEHISERRKIRS